MSAPKTLRTRGKRRSPELWGQQGGVRNMGGIVNTSRASNGMPTKSKDSENEPKN